VTTQITDSQTHRNIVASDQGSSYLIKQVVRPCVEPEADLACLPEQVTKKGITSQRMFDSSKIFSALWGLFLWRVVCNRIQICKPPRSGGLHMLRGPHILHEKNCF